MAGFLVGGEGDVKDIYLTEYELLNNYVQGNLWVWGRNNEGQLGTNDRTNRSSPVQTVSGGTNWKSGGAGFLQFSSIKSDGSLWVWGDNDFGELGTNNITSYSSPIQTISGGTDWKQVWPGNRHTSAIKTDGSLWLWGRNQAGQLGTNNITSYSSPIQTVSGGNEWKHVVAGQDYTSAIKTDGTLWMWGINTYGQLGTNDIVHRSSPVQTVSGGTDWKQISINIFHTAAIKTDGTLWLWGRNNYGQLGTNNRTSFSSPVQTVSGGSDWKYVGAGLGHTIAIKNDGTLWTWGLNSNGQLGTNNRTDISSPIQTISGGNDWKQLSAGHRHSAALKTDGTLWVWGSNLSGELGTNNGVYYSSPVQTVSGGSDWKLVIAQFHSTSGIKYNL